MQHCWIIIENIFIIKVSYVTTNRGLGRTWNPKWSHVTIRCDDSFFRDETMLRISSSSLYLPFSPPLSSVSLGLFNFEVKSVLPANLNLPPTLSAIQNEEAIMGALCKASVLCATWVLLVGLEFACLPSVTDISEPMLSHRSIPPSNLAVFSIETDNPPRELPQINRIWNTTDRFADLGSSDRGCRFRGWGPNSSVLETWFNATMMEIPATIVATVVSNNKQTKLQSRCSWMSFAEHLSILRSAVEGISLACASEILIRKYVWN